MSSLDPLTTIDDPSLRAIWNPMKILKIQTTIDRAKLVLIEAEGWCDELYWSSIGLPLKQAAIRQRNRIRQLLDAIGMLLESSEPRALNQFSPKETGPRLQSALDELKAILPRTARELDSQCDTFVSAVRQVLEFASESLVASGASPLSEHVFAVQREVGGGKAVEGSLQNYDLQE